MNNLVTRFFRGWQLCRSLLKNEKYNAPLAESGQAYRECLTCMLLLLSVIEADYPRAWITLQQSP